MITPHGLFTLLADETRLRCLSLISGGRKVCVCEFSIALESIQPKISRHLSILLRSGLVKKERKGHWVYYYLNEDLEEWTRGVLDTVFTRFQNSEPYKSDMKKMKEIDKASCCS